MTRSTNHPHYQTFLTLLRSERKRRNITQVVVAERLGNRQTFVSKLENGDRRLDIIELLEYLDAIGADAGAFVSALRRKIGAGSQDQKLSIRPAKARLRKKSSPGR